SEDQDAIIVLEENIGPVRCGVIVRPEGRGFAEFDAPKLSQPSGAAASTETIAAALGLAKSEIGFENHRPSRYDAGLDFTFVPVNGLDAIAKAQIVPAMWADAFGAGQGGVAGCAYLYCRDTVRHDCDFHARMFTPTGGIGEDPATGSAAAAFAGVVKHFDDPRDGTHVVHIEQGVEMNRPSCIKLEIDVEGGDLHAVRIGGNAIIVAEGKLNL
ncbi:MAG: PhzF family phenazine biosynthesis protein, partial [Hyphomicrobiales bacterium]|nr:PhzF family phenazine biosynthesis protein [Hyphomicrobiales bacterium]